MLEGGSATPQTPPAKGASPSETIAKLKYPDFRDFSEKIFRNFPRMRF
jgi:hypothetical protein